MGWCVFFVVSLLSGGGGNRFLVVGRGFSGLVLV